MNLNLIKASYFTENKIYVKFDSEAVNTADIYHLKVWYHLFKMELSIKEIIDKLLIR